MANEFTARGSADRGADFELETLIGLAGRREPVDRVIARDGVEDVSARQAAGGQPEKRTPRLIAPKRAWASGSTSGRASDRRTIRSRGNVRERTRSRHTR